MINLIKLWSQNFFASKKFNQVPSNLFFILAIQLELWSSQGLLQILNTNFLKISSLWIYIHPWWRKFGSPMLSWLCHRTMVLALPDFFRCPPPLNCLPSKLAFRLHCCSRTQSDRLEGKQHFFIAFCITSRKWDTFFEKLFCFTFSWK